MLDWRTLAIGAAVFSATFAGGWWLGVGKSNWSFGLPGANASTSQQPSHTTGLTPSPAAASWPQGKGLVDDERIRRVVVLGAQAYQRPSCNADSRWIYVNAATKYAEALMRAAGCHNVPRCPMGEGSLDRVWQANRSILDRPVAEAMAAAHMAGGLTDKDFRGDVGRAVRVIAGTDLPGGSMPDCEEAGSRRSGWRIRRR